MIKGQGERPKRKEVRLFELDGNKTFEQELRKWPRDVQLFILGEIQAFADSPDLMRRSKRFGRNGALDYWRGGKRTIGGTTFMVRIGIGEGQRWFWALGIFDKLREGENKEGKWLAKMEQRVEEMLELEMREEG